MNIRKFTFWSMGIAVALAPVAVAASCGSSDETSAPQQQSIDTSQVDLSSVSVGGTATSPSLSLGGTFLPANTALRYKIGSSDWLDEAAFKAYVIANASKLADADLGAVKARLVSASEKFTLSTPKEVAASGKISRSATTPPVTSIDTSAANLSVITASGSTTAPVINLNGFTAPANTILLFQIASSQWLNGSGIRAYITTNAASLTTAQLSAVKAHLEPVSALFTLSSNREVTLTGSITKPATTTSVDTSAANLSVITVGGSTAAPVINLNGFAAPANALLRFQVGASLWLDQAGVISYITTNAASLTATQLSAIKAHLEPSSAAYTITNSREVTLTGSITKPPTTTSVNTSSANLSVMTIGGTTAAPVINLNGFVAPANTLLRFQVGASAWLDQSATLVFITTNAATLTTAQLSALKAHLEPASAAYTLTSNREVTLTGMIVKVINTSAISLGAISLSGTTTAPLINLNGITTPDNTVLRFKVGSSAWLEKDSFIAFITANATTLSEADLSAAKAHLETVSSAYSLTSDREATLVVTIIIPVTGPINTSSISLASVTLEGTTAAPIINLNGVSIPRTTILNFQIGSSSWLSEADFKSFIVANNSWTIAELRAAKVKILPADSSNQVTSDREATMTSKIKKLIDVGGTNINPFAFYGPRESVRFSIGDYGELPGTKLQFSAGASGWLDRVPFEAYVRASTPETLSLAQIEDMSVRIAASSDDYAVTQFREWGMHVSKFTS